MKKLLLLATMIILPLLGCEKEEEEKCDCDQCPCEQIRDAEPEEEAGGEVEEGDMGLEQEGGSEEDPEEEQAGGAEEEDLEGGDQDASEEEEPIEEPPVEECVEEADC